MSNLRLRLAEKKDMAIMVYMLKEMHEESGMGSLNISKVLNTIELCLIKGVILLVERNKEAVALMGLIPNALWWTDDKLLMDQFTFVRPEARKTKAIFKLVKEAKMIAKAEKMPLLIANFGYVNEEKVSKMYKRFGKSLGVTVITGDTSSFLWR